MVAKGSAAAEGDVEDDAVAAEDGTAAVEAVAAPIGTLDRHHYLAIPRQAAGFASHKYYDCPPNLLLLLR